MTLERAQSEGLKIKASCYRCRRFGFLDIAGLIKKLGAAFNTENGALARKITCSKCGRKNVDIELVQNEQETARSHVRP